MIVLDEKFQFATRTAVQHLETPNDNPDPILVKYHISTVIKGLNKILRR